MKYSESFKSRMLQKMALAGGPSATALSREVGVPQQTLSRWQREAGIDPMSKTTSRRPQDWSAQDKMTVVLEAAVLPEPELGAFLRRRGIHQAQLDQWRQQMLQGLETSPKASAAEKRRIRLLEKEIQRKDKALAEASALLVLKKKAAAIWGAEDDDTEPRSAK